MHELYIAQCILKSVCDSLPPEMEPERVESVQIQVGHLDAVVPETLRFLFEAIKSEYGCSQAKLVIEEIPVRCRCVLCAHEFGIDLPIFICPDCGSTEVRVLQGRGITLTGITATEMTGAICGNPRHP